jgi:hypothetical protein
MIVPRLALSHVKPWQSNDHGEVNAQSAQLIQSMLQSEGVYQHPEGNEGI